MVSYGKGRLKMRRPSALTSLLVLLLFGILLSVPSIANVPTTAAHKEHAHAPDELLISFHPGTATEVINDFYAEYELKEKDDLDSNREDDDPEVKLVKVLRPKKLADPERLMRALEQDYRVEYVELNYLLFTEVLPGDPQTSQLWGLHNTGLTGGTVDADIDAPEAWDTTTGSLDVGVAVIDTGVDYTHEDLYLNVWLNQGEIPPGLGVTDTDGDGQVTFYDLNDPANASHVSDLNGTGYIDAGDLLADPAWANGVDEDGNSRIDDLVGWDFYNNDNDPYDDHSHGTHVSGTIGAVGDNGVGVVGVNWNVQIMGLKFLSAGGSGSAADAILAVQYTTDLRNNGVNIVLTSNSWGGGGFSTALYDVIAASGAAGLLFVAAAGNSGLDSDVLPHYPSSYDLASVISVAATDYGDNRASFSNYGAVSVDLGAPGVGTLSTTPGNTYSTYSGTSMATPHVSGVAALAWT